MATTERNLQGKPMLTARQTRRLSEVLAEIDLLDHRIATAHAIGDSNSSQGISTTFNNLVEMTNRRDALRAIRDALEAKQAGEPAVNPGVSVSYYNPL